MPERLKQQPVNSSPREDSLLPHPEAVPFPHYEGTLRDLGHTKEIKPQFELTSQRFFATALPDPDSEGKIVMARFSHPLAGQHLAQIEGAVVPVGVGSNFAAIGDLMMPEQAKRQREIYWKKVLEANSYAEGNSDPEKISEGEAARLDRIHVSDPDIGRRYFTFRNTVLSRWQNAHDNRSADSLFLMLDPQNLTLIDSQELLQTRGSEIFGKMDSSFYMGVWGLRYDEFRRFLSKDPNFRQTLSHLHISNHDKYLRLESDQRLYYIENFLNSLTTQEKQGYCVDYVVNEQDNSRRLYRNYYSTIVDIDSTNLWRWENKPVDGTFVYSFKKQMKNPVSSSSNGEVTISDQGSSVTLAKGEKKKEGLYDWTARGYSFSDEYVSKSLFGLLAYRKVEGKRIMLEQQEAEKVARMNGITWYPQDDVYAGGLFASYFSPDIAKRFKPKIRLKQGDYPQPMMEGQAGILYLVHGHDKMLFGDGNPLWRAVEKPLAA